MENPPWKTHYCLHVHKIFFKEYKIMNKSTKWTFVRKCRVEIRSSGPHFFNHDGCVNIIVFGPKRFGDEKSGKRRYKSDCCGTV